MNTTTDDRGALHRAAGLPGAGRYATKNAPEAEVALGAPVVSTEYVNGVISDRGWESETTWADIQTITSELNQTRNFSDENFNNVCETHFRSTYGYTPKEKIAFSIALDTLRSNGYPGIADDAQKYVDALAGGTARQEPEAVASGTGNFGSPMAHTDSFIQSGGIADQIRVDDMVFTRSTSDTPDGHISEDRAELVRLQFNRPISDEEISRLGDAVNYVVKANMSDKEMTEPERDTPFSFYVAPGGWFREGRTAFEDRIASILADGSDPRVTNRTGPIGSRAIEPFDDNDTEIEMYYGVYN